MPEGATDRTMGKSGTHILFLLFFLILPVIAYAQSEEEKNFLLMYFKEEELQVVSAIRSLKPISRIAENMTVVTAEDIERMNAHSLADVLNTVTGLQVNFSPPSPGNWSTVSIQGSDQKHVTVLVDGVPVNQLVNNIANIGDFPVQHIERIEIIKGPASSAWGSALGGVINIITKEPPDKGVRGTASGSYGSNHTEDYRAEVRARSGDVGIYLYAGGLHTNGFGYTSGAYNNHIYSKLTYSVLPSTDIRFSLFYQKTKVWTGDFSAFDVADNDKKEEYYGSLAVTSRLTRDITLDIGAWAKRRNDSLTEDFISTGLNNWAHVYDDRRQGANARVAWKLGDQTIVAGTEYDSATLKSDAILDGKQKMTKWAVFANDTISIGDFAVTPGVRYDNITPNGDFISPSLGVTYLLTKRTILRATAARGFFVPSLLDTYGSSSTFLPNPDLNVERVWSYQAGAETGELKYVWLKASLFRHDINDIIDSSGALSVNAGKQRRQGFELEMKTMSVYNMYLSGGTTYIFAKDRSTGEIIIGVPKYTYDMALNYDDKKSFRAVLKGRYIWWNMDASSEAKYSSFVVDISAAKKIYSYDRHSIEIFASAHNLFNGMQDTGVWYKTPRRWEEVGLRYKF